jgi:toxin-antitoxin system PIN domain toxin
VDVVFVVDTNVLVYAVNTHAPQHPKCYALLESWQDEGVRGFVTWPICYEFLRVATNPVALASPLTLRETWSFLQALFDSGFRALLPTVEHSDYLKSFIEAFPQLSSSLLHDAHTAVLMQEHGIKRIYSGDTDFHRFPFLEVIDPLKP